MPWLVLVLAACTTGATSPSSVAPVVSGEVAGLEFSSVATFEDGATLAVTIADDDDERSQGLMWLTSLPADRGMAFVWDEPVSRSFWMKNTLIPLSIAFVGEDERVVAIREMEPCSEDPCPLYGADARYAWAVEANAGWFEVNGVSVGDGATLEMLP